ncbi:MAG: glycosyl hydrolase, partial [Gemmatimonadaceae bacterium]
MQKRFPVAFSALLALGAASTAVPLALAAQPNATTLIPVAKEFEKLHFRSIGPATMSGRISDVAVYEANPAIYYVGTAHGGVWKTTSNGSLFTPLFQDQGLMAIGDVTVSQTNPDIVWVGTGESNNRQSTSWGSGVYKSIDGGKTFVLMGLPESKHINRIVINPTNNDIVLVAATGPLFGPGGERGIFRTTDGGKTWMQTLSVDDETGANDVAMSNIDPNIVYASTYQRRRTTCCMNGGGPGSGLWKSIDGGATWKRVTGSGFPGGSLGRIAVEMFRGNANIVYAAVEGPARGAVAPSDESAAAVAQGGTGGITGLYRSDDGGATWQQTSANNARPMYFSQVRIDPQNADRVYMA